MIEFEAWPKTPRLSAGGVTITEKIDGTNACVVIMPENLDNVSAGHDANAIGWVDAVGRYPGQGYLVGAQSRKKLIKPGKDTDNAGFAGWVQEHMTQLVDVLGPGRHFGEWWGQGIQRRYDMDRKVFSLFNTYKWQKIANDRPDWWDLADKMNLDIVPVLHQGRFSDQAITDSLNLLREEGSIAALKYGVRFSRPEGVIIRHQSLGGNLKAFIENDDVAKGLQ
jgi:RNA ligase-like protein